LIEVILKVASSHTKEQIKDMLVRKDTAIIGLIELLFRMNPDDFGTVEYYYDQLPFLANNVISRIKEVADDEDKLSELENDLQSKIGNQMASLMLMMLVKRLHEEDDFDQDYSVASEKLKPWMRTFLMCKHTS
jgi:hypothetical protein